MPLWNGLADTGQHRNAKGRAMQATAPVADDRRATFFEGHRTPRMRPYTCTVTQQGHDMTFPAWGETCVDVWEAASDRFDAPGVFIHVKDAHPARVAPDAGAAAQVDTALMMAAGSITGPFRRTRPVTITPLMRARRWIRNMLRGVLA